MDAAPLETLEGLQKFHFRMNGEVEGKSEREQISSGNVRFKKLDIKSTPELRRSNFQSPFIFSSIYQI